MFISHWKVSSDFWVLCCLGPAEGKTQTFFFWAAWLPIDVPRISWTHSAQSSRTTSPRGAADCVWFDWTENSFASRYLAGELYDGSCYSNSYVGELGTYKYEASDGDVMVWQHAFDLRAFGLKGAAAIVRSFQCTLVHCFIKCTEVCVGLWSCKAQAKKWSLCTTTPTKRPSATSETWSRRPRSSLRPWWTSALTSARACMPRSTSLPLLGWNVMRNEAVLNCGVVEGFDFGSLWTIVLRQVWASRLRILLNNYSNGDPFSPKLRVASG